MKEIVAVPFRVAVFRRVRAPGPTMPGQALTQISQDEPTLCLVLCDLRSLVGDGNVGAGLVPTRCSWVKVMY